MKQLSLSIYERVEEALAEVINECGGRKRFAAEMWPNKPQRDAHNLLDACLNPERREKFAPHDLVYILRRGRAVGCDVAMDFVADACGYTRPIPVNPEDEKAKLQREVVEAARTLERSIDRLERLTQPPLQAVSGGKG
jgi:hypothetical protein